LKDALCCLFIFYLVSHLSKTAFDHLLQLLRLFLPRSGLPRNTEELLRLFRGSDDKTRIHEYCENCQVAFGESDKKCPQCDAWRYKGGEADQAKKRKRAFFIELPIEHDLQDLFKSRIDLLPQPVTRLFLITFFPSLRLDPEFTKGLEYRRTRKYTKGVLEDIQDGKAYQDLLRPGGFLHDQPWNIVLGFNTDGVSPYKSSHFQMWPIFWQVLDLPPNIRFQPKLNRICGLWFGKSKPRFNLFLQPFHSEMTRFYGELFFFVFFFFFFFFFEVFFFFSSFFFSFSSFPPPSPNAEKGFEVRINGQKEISKGLVLTGTMDSPAKADVQHHTHHNGYCGCPFCLNPGESASTGKGHTHVYRCNSYEERTHQGTMRDAKEALETGKPVIFPLPSSTPAHPLLPDCALR